MQFVSVVENMSTLNKNLAIIRHDRGSGRENVEKLNWMEKRGKKERKSKGMLPASTASWYMNCPI